MTYKAPLADILFTLEHVVHAGQLAQTERFADSGPEVAESILSEGAKLADAVIAPLNRGSDLQGAKLENGIVRSSPGFADAYRAMADGGWVGMSANPDHGGMGLPLAYATAFGEMVASASLSLSLCPLLSQGAIEALEAHGTEAQKALYLPKLTAGTWTGTMNLTEPQAGSDVGALRTKAEANADGSWSITGQKIFITWGDHDMAENIVHLVLARTPGGVPGTKGISLFIVPKFLPDAAGKPGVRNNVKVVSLEHKLGIHGSPTCVMAFEGAKGWLLGPEFGGMACMFTMMNNARLGVATEGAAVAEAAYQHALAYAQERKQGRTPIGDGKGPIADFADVRRMLTTMKAQIFAARALCYDTALHLDLAKAASTAGARAEAAAMGAFLTPIAKAFATDTGSEVADQGVQIWGGMGFIEEAGAAQFYRDVRITRIYEGTNGIQAMDLIGRKLTMDGGATARRLIERSRQTALALEGQPLGGALGCAVRDAEQATDWMLAADANDRAAGAVAYLRLLALVAGGHYHGQASLADPARGPLATVFALQLLPQTSALLSCLRQGAAALYAVAL